MCILGAVGLCLGELEQQIVVFSLDLFFLGKLIFELLDRPLKSLDV